MTAATEIMQEGKWLGDEHVDHAQHLLGSSFPSVSGFQSTIVFDSKNCVHVKTPNNRFVQILHVHSNHWLTVSNVECNGDTVKIYNSMNSTRLETNSKFMCQIAALVKCQNSVRVEYVTVKQQQGASDCGLFAIAFATSLCFGLPPENQNFVQSEMRAHLSVCFLEGKMSPFPVGSPLVTLQNDTFCSKTLSRKPEYEGDSLVKCMLCMCSYHLGCEDGGHCSIFICDPCKSEIGP